MLVTAWHACAATLDAGLQPVFGRLVAPGIVAREPDTEDRRSPRHHARQGRGPARILATQKVFGPSYVIFGP
jgi:hypothetical protein